LRSEFSAMRIHPGRSGIKSRRRGSDWASRDNRRASTITRLIATGTPSGDASDARGGRARARTNRFARTLRSSLALVVMCSLESQLMHPTAARSYAGAAPVEQQVPSADKAHHARAQMRTSRAPAVRVARGLVWPRGSGKAQRASHQSAWRKTHRGC